MLKGRAWLTTASIGFAKRTTICPLAPPPIRGAGRAGLVGTQNLRNHQSYMDGLEHVVRTGANPLKDAPAGTEPNPSDVNKPGDVSQLTAEEQMAPYEKELKENDWGHQPG